MATEVTVKRAAWTWTVVPKGDVLWLLAAAVTEAKHNGLALSGTQTLVCPDPLGAPNVFEMVDA